MSNYTRKVTDFYDFLIYDLADPRTNDWFLVKQPGYLFLIIGLYLYFVNSLGPRLMKNRKPCNLKNTLIIYNFLQVLLSLYMFLKALQAWFNYSWRCQPVDFSNSPQSIQIARAVHIYYLAKVSELLDTVFFVLRKKDNQITFLHQYHHTIMPLASWGATKYLPGGHGVFIGLINTFVHVIMYTYYMLAAIGPQYQKYLWWKRYITTMQLAQFCLAFLYNLQLLYTDCGYPKWTLCLTLPNAIFFYYLFFDFYKMAYGPSEKENKVVEENNNNEKLDNCTDCKVSSSEKVMLNGHINRVKLE